MAFDLELLPTFPLYSQIVNPQVRFLPFEGKQHTNPELDLGGKQMQG